MGPSPRRLEEHIEDHGGRLVRLEVRVEGIEGLLGDIRDDVRQMRQDAVRTAEQLRVDTVHAAELSDRRLGRWMVGGGIIFVAILFCLLLYAAMLEHAEPSLILGSVTIAVVALVALLALGRNKFSADISTDGVKFEAGQDEAG